MSTQRPTQRAGSKPCDPTAGRPMRRGRGGEGYASPRPEGFRRGAGRWRARRRMDATCGGRERRGGGPRRAGGADSQAGSATVVRCRGSARLRRCATAPHHSRVPNAELRTRLAQCSDSQGSADLRSVRRSTRTVSCCAHSSPGRYGFAFVRAVKWTSSRQCQFGKPSFGVGRMCVRPPRSAPLSVVDVREWQ